MACPSNRFDDKVIVDTYKPVETNSTQKKRVHMGNKIGKGQLLGSGKTTLTGGTIKTVPWSRVKANLYATLGKSVKRSSRTS